MDVPHVGRTSGSWSQAHPMGWDKVSSEQSPPVQHPEAPSFSAPLKTQVSLAQCFQDLFLLLKYGVSKVSLQEVIGYFLARRNIKTLATLAPFVTR